MTMKKWLLNKDKNKIHIILKFVMSKTWDKKLDLLPSFVNNCI